MLVFPTSPTSSDLEELRAFCTLYETFSGLPLGSCVHSSKGCILFSFPWKTSSITAVVNLQHDFERFYLDFKHMNDTCFAKKITPQTIFFSIEIKFIKIGKLRVILLNFWTIKTHCSYCSITSYFIIFSWTSYTECEWNSWQRP